MASTDDDKVIMIHKCDLDIIEGALYLTQGYTPKHAAEGVMIALSIIKNIRNNQPDTQDICAQEKLLDDLAREFMGKTESEIKDIMFFKLLELRKLLGA